MVALCRISSFVLSIALFVVSIPDCPADAQVKAGGSIAYMATLPDGRTADVHADGIVRIFSKDRSRVETRVLPITPRRGFTGAADINFSLPERGDVLATLAKPPSQKYASDRIIIVYGAGVSSSSDRLTVDTGTLRSLHPGSVTVPRYTNDASTNRTLAQIGVDSSERLFSAFNRSTLAALRSTSMSATGRPGLDFTNAYRLHITNSSVLHAVRVLAQLPTVAYASPDWTVETLHTKAVHIAQYRHFQSFVPARALARGVAGSVATSILPTNYGLSSSLQSMLNAPSNDVAAAYDEIERRFNQLPGQGEIITNVSLGDLDDRSAAANTKDPCHYWVTNAGPTTEVLGGQRYLNLPSMPLIPTYTSDANGNLNGSGEVCGVDPQLGEVDLDFTQMAPLPHDMQRPGETGNGLTDLLGIAPGAQYRLIVPGDAASTISDVQAALLGAALQTPRPDVITASLGYGLDAYGFPGRYLEDDPLTEAIVSSIVHTYRIVVCISAGDGTRLFTPVAIGPTGGSVATNQQAAGGTATDLNDVGFSTAPSEDFDSGAIDVGGSTLDDIFAAPPQNPQFSLLTSQHAFAETRWTGEVDFSSGFGSRVNVSAPADNIVSFEHTGGGAADAVDVVLNGGTSASSPEVAAAAAVIKQVGRLSGEPFTDPVALRSFLQQTASTVGAVTQADRDVSVGPQLDLGRAVSALLEKSGVHPQPLVPRVGVEQRRNVPYGDAFFESDTDPANIDLQNSSCSPTCTFQALDEYAWITIAPDWEFIPPSTHYSLKVAGTNKVIATTPWARLQPQTILGAAGFPLVSPSSRTVKLTYTASYGSNKAISIPVDLTFSAAPALSDQILAPNVPSVVHGASIPVTYDLTHAAHVSGPELIVTEPGRVTNFTDGLYHSALTMPLTAQKGTVQVPVSALQGGGIYGIAIDLNAGSTSGEIDSDFAFTRVVPPNATDARPSAPLLSSNGSTPAHFLEVPYGGSFQLSYDVRNVPGATGAEVEISAPGASIWGIYNPFNNPNGSIRDRNGVDSGSVYIAPLSGTTGTVTLNAATIGLDPAMNHVVRVIPLQGGSARGEAGDVSSVTMDGVLPSDGGYVIWGYGINGAGFDGLLTSVQLNSAGQYVSSLELFDQTTNSVTRTIASESGDAWYFLSPQNTYGGWGIYGNDVGLFGLYNVLNNSAVYKVLNPVAAGKVTAPWTPPYPVGSIRDNAVNQTNDTGVFLTEDATVGATSTWHVFTSDILSNVFGSPIDISSPLKGLTDPTIWGFAQNTSTHNALAVGIDAEHTYKPPVIITVDLKTNVVSSFTGVGCGGGPAAIDSVTGTAVIPTDSCNPRIGLGIYQPANKTGFEVPFPAGADGDPAIYASVDERHGEFVLAQITPPDIFTNHNAMSRVYTYDEHGNLLKTIAKFNLFNVQRSVHDKALQLNAGQRTAYLLGPIDSQIQPFQY